MYQFHFIMNFYENSLEPGFGWIAIGYEYEINISWSMDNGLKSEIPIWTLSTRNWDKNFVSNEMPIPSEYRQNPCKFIEFDYALSWFDDNINIKYLGLFPEWITTDLAANLFFVFVRMQKFFLSFIFSFVYGASVSHCFINSSPLIHTNLMRSIFSCSRIVQIPKTGYRCGLLRQWQFEIMLNGRAMKI